MYTFHAAMIYLLSAILAISLASSVFVLLTWLKRKHEQYRLLFALSLLAIHLFLVPFLIVSMQKQSVATSFNTFYVAAFPITFLGWILVYIALLRISRQKCAAKFKLCFFAWFAASGASAFYFFIVKNAMLTDHFFQIAPIVFFFLPIQALSILTTYTWFQKAEAVKAKSFCLEFVCFLLFSCFLLRKCTLPRVVC